MKNQSLKEVVREMCSLVPGGRDAMAGSLGLSLTSFNNRFYEKNGCRFFDHHDLMVMQEVSGTVLYAEYVAAESGMLLVDSPKKVKSAVLTYTKRASGHPLCAGLWTCVSVRLLRTEKSPQEKRMQYGLHTTETCRPEQMRLNPRLFYLPDSERVKPGVYGSWLRSRHINCVKR